MLQLLSLLFMTIFCLPSFGFETDYLAFDLPSSWMCKHNPPSWVCSPQSSKEMTEAIIVVTAKAAGPEDTYQLYLKHLSQPKMLTTSELTSPQPSQVIHAKLRMIGPQQWVEGFHLSSEVKDFLTLYLATRSQNLSILVSLSAEKAKARRYTKTFENVVDSLKVKPLPMKKQIAKGSSTGIEPVDQAMEVAMEQISGSQSLLDRWLSSNLLMAMSIALMAMFIAIFFYALK